VSARFSLNIEWRNEMLPRGKLVPRRTTLATGRISLIIEWTMRCAGVTG
jgi:hypothetical protein